MGEKSRHYFLLLLLFSASGCAALIYEVVWYQLLQLAIGSTSVSLGILLATFMGGLCIGSLGLPLLRTRQHPLRVYAALEFGIAICAILVQYGLPFLNRVYISGAEHGLPGMILRALLAAICILPPTILMGASLPAIVRWIKKTPDGISWWSYLYAGNTAGAEFGCLVAGFYLLRIYSIATATWCAVATNIAVAGGSLLMARRAPAADNGPEDLPSGEKEFADSAESRWAVYAMITLSGATALGAEVVWTRLLSMLLLGTVYVFSIILAVFLTGLAIGSAAGSRLIRRVNPHEALGWCQLCLVLGIAWTAYAIVHSLPRWSDDVLTTHNVWRMYWLI